MLELARARFARNDCVTLIAHDLSEPLPDLGTFDLVISGYAIHHLEDARKIALYREAFACTSPGGRFVNVEHVASPTEPLHQEFMAALGIATEDPSNHCVSVEAHLSWLRVPRAAPGPEVASWASSEHRANLDISRPGCENDG